MGSREPAPSRPWVFLPLWPELSSQGLRDGHRESEQSVGTPRREGDPAEQGDCSEQTNVQSGEELWSQEGEGGPEAWGPALTNLLLDTKGTARNPHPIPYIINTHTHTLGDTPGHPRLTSFLITARAHGKTPPFLFIWVAAGPGGQVSALEQLPEPNSLSLHQGPHGGAGRAA